MLNRSVYTVVAVFLKLTSKGIQLLHYFCASSLAGSRSIERYTGPQIRKMYETQEFTYHATERVSLISSFMASLLVGAYVAIDHSDAAGMTLMNLHDRTWSPEALNVSAAHSHLLNRTCKLVTLLS